MTRERLADGDDGSGNRYQVRDEYVCPVGVVVREITAREMDCWYCGKPLTSQSGKPKRRMEQGVWHKLHEACAQNWDNESKR